MSTLDDDLPLASRNSPLASRNSQLTTHTIRLRDPWHHEPTVAGGRRWMRAFHRPTGISDQDQVWLVVSGPVATVWLGDQILTPVAEGEGSRFEITARLENHNRLILEVPLSTPQRPFEVCLEIDAA